MADVRKHTGVTYLFKVDHENTAAAKTLMHSIFTELTVDTNPYVADGPGENFTNDASNISYVSTEAYTLVKYL